MQRVQNAKSPCLDCGLPDTQCVMWFQPREEHEDPPEIAISHFYELGWRWPEIEAALERAICICRNCHAIRKNDRSGNNDPITSEQAVKSSRGCEDCAGSFYHFQLCFLDTHHARVISDEDIATLTPTSLERLHVVCRNCRYARWLHQNTVQAQLRTSS